MVVVDISGRRSRVKEELVTSLIQHTSKEFFGRKKVVLYIKFVKLPGQITASVNNLDFRSTTPRAFAIKLENSMTIMRTLVSVAHELVHVRQYVDGHLFTDMDNANHRWMGTEHEMKSVHDSVINGNGHAYWRLPWEVEAHGLEKALVYEWMHACGHDELAPWYEKPF